MKKIDDLTFGFWMARVTGAFAVAFGFFGIGFALWTHNMWSFAFNLLVLSVNGSMFQWNATQRRRVQAEMEHHQMMRLAAERWDIRSPSAGG